VQVASLNGTGNELDNILIGNTGANILHGGLAGEQYSQIWAGEK
jgi:hypothetical protein